MINLIEISSEELSDEIEIKTIKNNTEINTNTKDNTFLLESEVSIFKTDTSLSTLDMPSWIEINKEESKIMETKASLIEDRMFPEIIDPVFKNYLILIPNIMKNLVEKIIDKQFVYAFINDLNIKILDFTTNAVFFSAEVIDFEDENIEVKKTTNIVFILNRSKIKNKIKNEENKEYREAVEQGKTFKKNSNEYEIKKHYFLDLQITTGINLIYIDKPEDLSNELKIITKQLTTENIFKPKVKSFYNTEKKAFFESILSNIPGISKNVAKSIVNEFKMPINLFNYLKGNNLNKLMKLEIWDEKKLNRRNLGKKQAEILKKVFLGTDGSKNIL